MKRLSAALFVLGLVFVLTACGAQLSTSAPQPSQTPAQSEPITPQPSAEPSPTPSETPEPEPEAPQWPVYEFGTPLEESEAAEDAAFEKAVFLGGSRTEGLQFFGGLKKGTYLCARGMTVFQVNSPNWAVFDMGGEKATMIEALRAADCNAVYIMLGVNELGYPAKSYESGLGKFIDMVLEAQPDAVVYLQLLPPVNDEVARRSGLADYINNTRLNSFNEAIVRVAKEKKVLLLNVPEVYRDEAGSLPAELTSDGCHFKAAGYARWVDYLRSHRMDPECYQYNRSLAADGQDEGPACAARPV